MGSMFRHFPREVCMRTRRVVKNEEQLQKYVLATNGKDNITTTVYGFRELKPKGNRGEYNTAIVPHFVVDLDKDRLQGMSDAEAGQRCSEEAWRLSAHLLENGWRHAVWFTGGGFHIWVNLDQEYVLEPMELNDLLVSGRALISKWVKDMDLQTLDPVVSFRPDRHIRIPNSFNFKRNIWSIPLYLGGISEGWDHIVQRAKEPSNISMCLMGDKGMPLEVIKRDPNNPFGPQGGGFAKQEFNAEEVEIEMKRIGNIPMLPCLAEATCETGANPPHLPRVYLMMYLLDYFNRFARPPSNSKISIDDRVNQAHAFIAQLKWADYKPDVTHKYLKHGAERQYQTPTCPTLYREGLCVGKCPFYDGKGVGN